MWVGSHSRPVRGQKYCGWAVAVMAAVFLGACSSDREERADAAESAASGAEGETGDVLAAFEAWAKDSDSGRAEASAETSGGAAASTGADGLGIELTRKVSACWNQPFGMPRLAKVRLLVEFNPDGTVREVTPHPEASEALLYEKNTPYIVMIAQSSQALRQCQPYAVIRANYSRLSRVEMVFDPNKLGK